MFLKSVWVQFFSKLCCYFYVEYINCSGFSMLRNYPNTSLLDCLNKFFIADLNCFTDRGCESGLFPILSQVDFHPSLFSLLMMSLTGQFQFLLKLSFYYFCKNCISLSPPSAVGCTCKKLPRDNNYLFSSLPDLILCGFSVLQKQKSILGWMHFDLYSTRFQVFLFFTYGKQTYLCNMVCKSKVTRPQLWGRNPTILCNSEKETTALVMENIAKLTL